MFSFVIKLYPYFYVFITNEADHFIMLLGQLKLSMHLHFSYF